MKHSGPMTQDWRNAGFGLYLHWPFCQSKCPYCDFNSHVSAQIDQARWQAAYLSEIDRIGRETEGRVLNSVFFGGGTPSLMDSALVQAILDRVRATWTLANDIEVTLEANPTSVEAGRFAGFSQAGVNRVSLGIQALNDADLRRLGRLHSAADARRAIDIAQATFDRVNIDLIYARQGQGLQAWEEELQMALLLGTDHLSLYQLTIEDGTVFGEMHAKKLLRGLPAEALSADMFELTQDLTSKAGFTAYEVSNHARPGAESLHNSIYWRMGDYAGIGPGAHGRLTLDGQRLATEAKRLPADWLQCVDSRGTGECPREILDAADQGVEYVMMSLRLREGTSLARFRALTGRDLPQGALDDLVGLGLLVCEDDRIRTTPQGVMVLNGVLRALLADRLSGA